MNITPQNLIAHELIGIEARIVESKDPMLMNISGKIVYETRKMLMLNVNGESKMIPKPITKLMLKLSDNVTCVVNGTDLVGRPEDRIQKLI